MILLNPRAIGSRPVRAIVYKLPCILLCTCSYLKLIVSLTFQGLSKISLQRYKIYYLLE